MQVVILHQTIAKYDAIGNDISHMQRILSARNECFIYCENLQNDEIKTISHKKLLDVISNENNLIIYHHSIYWRQGEQILNMAKAKIAFKYHNITHESFFEKYSFIFTQFCRNGRKQTQRLYKNFSDALWMGDSSYNFSEINLGQMSNKKVIPPFCNIEKWNDIQPDDGVLKALIESKAINLVFVGRIAPNKGHKMLLKIVSDYKQHYRENIFLNIIGIKDPGMPLYNEELEQLIVQLDLTEHVQIVGQVNDSQLLSYYLGSDFFVCCSDHEGFCVPLIEAQYFHLPVIAKKTTAVPEIIGPDQLLFSDDVREYSAAIKTLSEYDKYKEMLIDKGINNYEKRFAQHKIAKTFMEGIENFMGGQL